MIPLWPNTVCSAENRDYAILMMKDALFSFKISGIPTTIPFHISVSSNDKRFLEGNYDTSFINELRPFSSKDGEVAGSNIISAAKKGSFSKKIRRARPMDEKQIRLDTYI